MTTRVLTCAQRSPEWRQARAGLLTSSGADDATRFLKDGKTESAARRDYRTHLVAERLIRAPIESDFRNADMDRGVELEAEAIAAYEMASQHLVQTAGFIVLAEHAAGYSPDGLVADDGLIEVKCPRPANHLKYLRADVVPLEHLAQITHALWLTGREWIDFVSYAPVFPEGLRLFIKRLHRNDLAIAEYEAKAVRFLAEVDAEHAELLGRRALQEAV